MVLEELGKINIGCDGDSSTDLIVYRPDEDTAWKYRSQYEDEIREDVLDYLGYYEEPDYAVPPGVLYHRFSVEFHGGLVFLYATVALNV